MSHPESRFIISKSRLSHPESRLGHPKYILSHPESRLSHPHSIVSHLKTYPKLYIAKVRYIQRYRYAKLHISTVGNIYSKRYT